MSDAQHSARVETVLTNLQKLVEDPETPATARVAAGKLVLEFEGAAASQNGTGQNANKDEPKQQAFATSDPLALQAVFVEALVKAKRIVDNNGNEPA